MRWLVVLMFLLVLMAGCVSSGIDPSFGKVLNQTKAVVEEAEAFRPVDPAAK